MGQGASLSPGQRPHSRFEASRQPSSGPPKAADLRPNPHTGLSLPTTARRRGRDAPLLHALLAHRVSPGVSLSDVEVMLLGFSLSGEPLQGDAALRLYIPRNDGSMRLQIVLSWSCSRSWSHVCMFGAS